MPAQDQGVAVSTRRNRYTLVPRTLCFVTYDDDVLLLKGAPDKPIYPNKYNGVGGHVERDEDVFSAAAREIREETGLEPEELTLCGIVNIDVGAESGIGLFIFRARARTRAVRASVEGRLQWVPAANVDTLDLVEDLPILLPRVLAMQPGAAPFFAHYTYDEQDRLVVTLADADTFGYD